MALRRLSSEICSCRGKRSGDRRNARRQDVRSAPDRRRPSRAGGPQPPSSFAQVPNVKSRPSSGRSCPPRLNRTGIRPGCERLAPASTDGCGPAAEREVNVPFIRLDPGPIQKRADLARMSDDLEVTKGVPEADTRSQGKDQQGEPRPTGREAGTIKKPAACRLLPGRVKKSNALPSGPYVWKPT